MLQKKYFWRMTSLVHLANIVCKLTHGFKETETHGADSPARRLSSIAFLSAANRQNVSKATVGRSKVPLMAIGSSAVALFAVPLRVTDTNSMDESSSLDSECDATSTRSTYSSSGSEESYAYETLIDFRCLLCEALSSEGFLRMAGILCHVSLAGNMNIQKETYIYPFFEASYYVCGLSWLHE